MKRIILCIAAAFFVGHIGFAQAQAQQSSSTITFQANYQEPIPEDGNVTAARAKILQQIEKDCETAAKAFNRQCAINMINFQDGRNFDRYGNRMAQQGAKTLQANANMSLFGETPKQ